MKKTKKLSGKVVYDNWPYVRIHADQVEFPAGATGEYSVAEHSDFIMVIPVAKDGFVYLVKQYRYPPQVFSIEFPAGRIDDGESEEDAAHRELREEVGLETEKMVKLGSLRPANGFLTNSGHVFLAQNVEKVYEQDLDDSEDIAIIKCRLEDVDEKIFSGEIQDGSSMAAKQLFDIYNKRS